MASAGGISGQQLIEILLRITAETRGATQANQALSQLQNQSFRVGNEVTRAFGPKLFTSLQQFKGHLVTSGQSLINLAASTRQVNPILSQQADIIERNGLAMQRMGITGKVSVDEMTDMAASLSRTSQEYLKQAQSIERSAGQLELTLPMYDLNNKQQAAQAKAISGNVQQMQLQAAGLRNQAASMAQASGEIALNNLQYERLAKNAGVFGGEATNLQKIGQGLVLSFSLQQAAAGNLEAGLFGLGFSLLFVGRALLGWPLVVAAATTAAAILIPKLIEWAGANKDVETTQERLERRVTEVGEAAKAVKGPFGELAEEYRRLSEQGENVFAIQAQQIKEAGEVGENTKRIMEELGLTIEEMASIRGEVGAGLPNPEFLEDINRLAGLNNATMKDFSFNWEEVGKAVDDARDSLDAAKDSISDIITAVRTQIGQNQERLSILKREVDAERLHAQRVEAVNNQFRDLSRRSEEYWDDIISNTRRARDAEAAAIRDGYDQQIKAQQNALEAQTEAIRDAVEAQVEAIRDSFKDRIDAIKDASEEEIKESKKRAEELKKQQQELNDELSGLKSERTRIMNEITTNEAELAEIEQLIKKFGASEDLTAQLGIHKARQNALEQEKTGLDAQITTIEAQADSIDELIEKEEERQEAIKKTTEERIEAEQKAMQQAIKFAQDTADAQIKQAQRATEARIEQLRRGAQAAIDEHNRATAEIIKNFEEEKAKAQEVIDKLKEHALSQFDMSSKQRDYNKLLRETRDLWEQTNFFSKATAAQLEAMARATELARIGREQGLSPMAIRNGIIGMLQNKGIPDNVIRGILEGLNLPSFASGVGVVPGPIGAPTLAVVHGGERVTSSAGADNILPFRTGAEPEMMITVEINIENVNANSASDIERLSVMVSREIGKTVALNMRSRRHTIR